MVSGPETPPRRRGPDPMGKRALFWAAPASGGPPPSVPLGKHALYSAAAGPAVAADPVEHPMSERGPVRVTCQRCGAVSRISLLDLLIYQLPFGYWLPRGAFDHRMTCPSCSKRVWASVTLRR